MPNDLAFTNRQAETIVMATNWSRISAGWGEEAEKATPTVTARSTNKFTKFKDKFRLKFAYSRFHVKAEFINKNSIKLSSTERRWKNHVNWATSLYHREHPEIKRLKNRKRNQRNQLFIRRSIETSERGSKKSEVLNCKLFVRKISNNNSQLICIAWVSRAKLQQATQLLAVAVAAIRRGVVSKDSIIFDGFHSRCLIAPARSFTLFSS